MQEPWFIGPRLKIARANHHIFEFQAGLEKEATNFDGYRIRLDRESDPVNDILEFQVTKTINIIPFTLIAGDAIHNLRTALDHLWMEIAIRVAGDKQNKQLTFPMHKTRLELINTFNKASKKIRNAAPDICDLIVNEIKPYEGGNLPLWSLGQLDNIDKHRMPILVSSVQALRGVSGRGTGPNASTIVNCTYAIHGNSGKAEFFRPMSFPKTAKMEITNYGKPSFDIFFAEETVFKGRYALPLLRELSDLVFGVVNTIETHIQRREGSRER